jgi:hypothetical protein
LLLPAPFLLRFVLRLCADYACMDTSEASEAPSRPQASSPDRSVGTELMREEVRSTQLRSHHDRVLEMRLSFALVRQRMARSRCCHRGARPHVVSGTRRRPGAQVRHVRLGGVRHGAELQKARNYLSPRPEQGRPISIRPRATPPAASCSTR